MQYVLPKKSHTASKWITVTLISIYVIIMAILLFNDKKDVPGDNLYSRQTTMSAANHS